MSDRDPNNPVVQVARNGSVFYGSGVAQVLPGNGIVYERTISTGNNPEMPGRSAVIMSGRESTIIRDPQTIDAIEVAIRNIAPNGVNPQEETLANNLIRDLLGTGKGTGASR